MDSDLDTLIDTAGAKRSKRPRAGLLKTGQLSKGSKRSKKTPPLAPPVPSSVAASTTQASASTTAPSSQAVASAVAPTSLVGAPIMVEPQPPMVGQSSSAPLSKRPFSSRVQKLSISTHMDTYAMNNAAGSHGSTLVSDVMSWIGQSYGSLEVSQWQCLNDTRDCIALYEKSIEHTATPTQEGYWKHEAYLLFPVHLDGTLLDNANTMKAKNELFSTTDVLHIFRQLCARLEHMHNLDPPYAHNDVKPGNVLITHGKGQPPLAILMDFGSARPARRHIQSRSKALQLQEWASEHCSAPFRAPELWDCPSNADIDERTDIWSLGCTLYAIM
ncbi:protein kinase domain-containing protein ppk38-like [Humulus lupulus]|uniref:protein kinase domain-containing protein ppk38-like n=1 Tax=Humulus lupulus TaxID=3486 RepID=UPI002B400FB6|nr:protein kinase domain-containing protein ppk38-like [Humulus lupulus]